MGITFFGFLAYRIAPADSSITRTAWDFKASPRGEIPTGWTVATVALGTTTAATAALGTTTVAGRAVETEAETVSGVRCPPNIRIPAASVMKRTK
jgi:hypothetical protein